MTKKGVAALVHLDPRLHFYTFSMASSSKSSAVRDVVGFHHGYVVTSGPGRRHIQSPTRDGRSRPKTDFCSRIILETKYSKTPIIVTCQGLRVGNGSSLISTPIDEVPYRRTEALRIWASRFHADKNTILLTYSFELAVNEFVESE